MGKASLEREIRELRRQIEQLLEREGLAEDLGSSDAGTDLAHISGRLGKFLNTLHDDLRKVPTSTALGIFALGVLVGRLLSR